MANQSSLGRISVGLSELIGALEPEANMDPTSASAFLAQADIEPADLALWADFAHSARDSYGRKLVVRGPNFELMVMSWGPGDYSAIHDHGAADWGAVRYLGAADHATFHMQDGLLTIRERRTMELDDICTVDASLIHLMGNPTDTPFLNHAPLWPSPCCRVDHGRCACLLTAA